MPSLVLACSQLEQSARKNFKLSVNPGQYILQYRRVIEVPLNSHYLTTVLHLSDSYKHNSCDTQKIYLGKSCPLKFIEISLLVEYFWCVLE